MALIHRFLGQNVKIRDRGEVLRIKLQFKTVEINICRRLRPELHPFLSKILLNYTPSDVASCQEWPKMVQSF